MKAISQDMMNQISEQGWDIPSTAKEDSKAADKARTARVIAKGGETSDMQKARFRSPQRDHQPIPKNIIGR